MADHSSATADHIKRSIIMFKLWSKNKILCSMEDISESLRDSGHSITRMPDKEIFGFSLERIKLKNRSSNPTICLGSKEITFLEMVPLRREPTPMEILEWNYKVNLMAFTYSPEGTAAILKAHIPCSHGLTSKNLESLVRFWDQAIVRFRNDLRSVILN